MTAGVVLLYHRIAVRACDPWRLAVTPENFYEQLAFLRRRCRCVRLAELIDGAGDHDGDPRPRVAITFDDGYVDVLTRALPLLERFDLPATVFLPTGLLGSDRSFWWDDLSRVLLEPRWLPDVLELDVGGRPFHYVLGPDQELAAESADAAGASGWRAWEEPRTRRHRLYRRLWDELLPLGQQQQQETLAALREWAGVPAGAADSDRCLTPDEVRRLVAGGRIDLGAHSVHHPRLSVLPRAEQWREIEQSLAAVSVLTPSPVRGFALPYGKREHYTEETLELIGRAGFDWAFTNLEGTIDVRSNRFELPRCFVENGDAQSLARSLARWIGDRSATGDQTAQAAPVRTDGCAPMGRRRAPHAIVEATSSVSRPNAVDPAVGRVRFGQLRRLEPISRSFGFDRGSPVDRYYIESFLDRHRLSIRGRVLEIGDDRYTRQFGDDRVDRSDVLHVEEGHAGATIVADLSAAEHLPSDTWDAIVCTQTLHLVYDVPAALATLNRVLKPGGTLLTTVPGLSPISADQWAKSWYWSFTPLSWRRLMETAFPDGPVDVRAHGNVLTATAFLHGIAAGELERSELNAYDPRYPLVVTARAVKNAGSKLWTGGPAQEVLVSVIIPCHDQADLLEEAISSVEAQTYRSWELIVIDDGSSDATPEVASRHADVKLLRQANQGLSAARNTGLAVARGRFVVFLDADDRLLPNALSVGVEALSEHPECALVSGHHRSIARDGSPQEQWPAFHPPGGHYFGLLQGNFIAAIHSAMFRREALEALGGFDPSLSAAEDYDLYLRLARKFPIHCHGSVVAEYRRHPGSMTRDSGLLLASTLQSLRRQRPHLRGDRTLRGAYRAGMRWWREFYGGRLAAEVASPASPVRRRLRGLVLLARHHPRGLVALAAGRPWGAGREVWRRTAPPRTASFDGPKEVLDWLAAELSYRDEVLAQRELAMEWLEEKLAEARATIEARDLAIECLRGRIERPDDEVSSGGIAPGKSSS